MSTLILEPTQQAVWHRAVREASGAIGRTLNESLEAYLLMLLLRFTRRPEILRTIMARELLESLQQTGRARDERLRDVGDQCLILSGLFPGLAVRRRVAPTYFVELGRGAYGELAGRLAQSAAELYRELAGAFVALMDVLHAMRGAPALEGLSFLERWELWGRAGSRAALGTLSDDKGILPIAFEAPGVH